MGKEKEKKKWGNSRNSVNQKRFLPVARQECLERGWDEVDVILVTGDAYVDHPSFGVALIGRLLEKNGLRVAILSQPRHQDPEDFRRFGKPRLFFGITSGNLDSICSNYTGNARVRQKDVYSPLGNPYFDRQRQRQNRRRPDRACIRYTQLAKEAYKDAIVVLGGIEASLRRFTHYDYQQEALRSSILTDSKADILVYGMGERAILEIAQRLLQGKDLLGIKGTCIPLSDKKATELVKTKTAVVLPPFEKIVKEPALFLEAELIVDRHSRSFSTIPVLQRQKANWVLQEPPQPPLSAKELDELYSLPFMRLAHPRYPDVPASRMIKNSVTIIRGCPGNCSFCAINRHQGTQVYWRSIDSIIKELETIKNTPGFDGVITDLGGPTANLFGTTCALNPNESNGIGKGICKRHDCLYPTPCKNLRIDEDAFLELLKEVKKIKGIKRIFISSGLRMELLLRTPRLCREIFENHMPGRIKIAPEHTEDEVLELMHKPTGKLLEEFLLFTRSFGLKVKKRPRFSAYFISAHPGCRAEHMKRACEKIKRFALDRIEVQDFTPTPGTISTAMYVSGLHRDRLCPIFVPKKRGERKEQRNIIMGCAK